METGRKEKEEECIFTSFFDNANYLYEECFDKIPYFIKWDKENKTWEKVNEFKNSDITYKPIMGDELIKGAVVLPTEPLEYGTEEELEEGIIAHIHKWLDVSEEFERFACYNIKLSWGYDKFNTLSYTRAIGDTGTGKSRFLFTLGHLHYKPMIVAGSLTPAVIFRIINKWKGTLLIDEGDQEKSDETNAFIKIMNCGYERGMPVSRCDKNDPNKIDFFDVFCPKVITTRKRFQDKATEARCMTTIMVQTSRTNILDVLTNEYYQETKILRNKLLMWKFRNYDKINPNAGFDIDLSKYEPRLRQVNRSFISLFVNNKPALDKFLKHLDTYQMNIIEERASSFDGIIINCLAKMIADGWEHITPTDIANAADEGGHNFKHPVTGRSLGKRLKGMNLKFERKRVDGKVKNILIFDKPMLKNIFSRYIVDEELIKEVLRVTFVTSVKESPATINGDDNGESTCQRKDRNKRNNVTQTIIKEETIE